MLNDSDIPIIPRKHLFENPAYLNPRISPDGRWLSWVADVDGVMNVWIAPSEDPATSSSPGSASFDFTR